MSNRKKEDGLTLHLSKQSAWAAEFLAESAGITPEQYIDAMLLSNTLPPVADLHCSSCRLASRCSLQSRPFFSPASTLGLEVLEGEQLHLLFLHALSDLQTTESH